MTQKKITVKSNGTNNKKLTLPGEVRRKLLRLYGASSEIARMAGVSRYFVSKVLNGHKSPTPSLFSIIVLYMDLEGERMSSESMKMSIKHAMQQHERM